ncbi:MAG: DUF2726 domain-containing protein [Betaproteobacteria bacterium]|nr:DUF2726 domain-containing protein [Betaproteobacteria bacterium]
MLWYLLIALAPIAAVVYIVWTHRKRAAARVAASSRRFEQILGASSQRVAAPVAPALTPVSPGASAARVSTAPVAAGGAPLSYLRKERLLDPQHALLFRMLASGLPEYEVFVHVSLAAVIEIPLAVQGREREQRLRALAQNVVDCLVCSKEMEVIAAVDLEAGATADSRIKSEYLKAARVRYVRINAAALPAATEVRKLLLDETG